MPLSGSHPLSGSLRRSSHQTAGLAQTFAAVYGDTNGYATLKTVEFLVGPGSGVGAIWLKYDRIKNLLSIYNDDGSAVLKSCSPGSAVVLKNSQGKLNCEKTSVKILGMDLVVNWNIIPKAAFVSPSQPVVMMATNTSDVTTGPVVMGSWTILATNTPPSLGSLAPDTLTSPPDVAQTFAASYRDPDGYANIKKVDLRISRTGGGTKAIWVTYDRNKDQLSIYNNAGTAVLQSCTPGSAAILQNSQGKLDCQQTTVTGLGDDLTVRLEYHAENSICLVNAKAGGNEGKR